MLDELSAMLAVIYDAAIDNGGWQKIADVVAEAQPGFGVSLVIRRPEGLGDSFVTAGYPPGAVEDFVENHVLLCPWNDVERDSKVGVPYATEDVMPLESITYSRFYKNWLVPYNLGGGFGLKICDYPDCQASIFLDGAIDQANARKAEKLRFLERLYPHLRRAMELSRRLIDMREDGVRVGLARTAEACAIVDAHATVVHMNDGMRRLIELGHCGLTQGQRLRLQKSDDMSRLTAILADAAAGRRSMPWPQYLAFEVVGQTGPNIIEFDALNYHGDDDAAGVVSLVRPGTTRHFSLTMRVRSLMRGPTAENIRVGLGLTPKQAEAVWSLIHGESIDRQAQDKGLSVDGVRWHFKNIYQRTGCSSQAELVRLVVSLFGRPAD